MFLAFRFFAVIISDLHLNTGQIKDVPKNPRFIKDERYEALKKSIEDDPEMLQLREIVDILSDALKSKYPPLGVALVMEGEHLCKSMRGAKKKGKMKSSYLVGAFKDDAQLRNEFFNLIK